LWTYVEVLIIHPWKFLHIDPSIIILLNGDSDIHYKKNCNSPLAICHVYDTHPCGKLFARCHWWRVGSVVDPVVTKCTICNVATLSTSLLCHVAIWPCHDTSATCSNHVADVSSMWTGSTWHNSHMDYCPRGYNWQRVLNPRGRLWPCVQWTCGQLRPRGP